MASARLSPPGAYCKSRGCRRVSVALSPARDRDQVRDRACFARDPYRLVLPIGNRSASLQQCGLRKLSTVSLEAAGQYCRFASGLGANADASPLDSRQKARHFCGSRRASEPVRISCLTRSSAPPTCPGSPLKAGRGTSASRTSTSYTRCGSWPATTRRPPPPVLYPVKQRARAPTSGRAVTRSASTRLSLSRLPTKLSNVRSYSSAVFPSDLRAEIGEREGGLSGARSDLGHPATESNAGKLSQICDQRVGIARPRSIVGLRILIEDRASRSRHPRSLTRATSGRRDSHTHRRIRAIASRDSQQRRTRRRRCCVAPGGRAPSSSREIRARITCSVRGSC